MKLFVLLRNEIHKSKVFYSILGSCFIILFLLVFITEQAIVETENWKFFDIDFTNKEKVISGYSGLLGAILSSLSIILLAYTIYLQNREAKEQKISFENEKLREENKEKENKFSLIKLISIFLDSIIKHIEDTGVELSKFIVAEKKYPLKMNPLFFLVNKSISKLIEMDHLSIFKGFEVFLSDEEEWISKYQQLFNSVGFYNDALIELRVNYDYHKNDKFSRQRKIGDDLQNIMAESARLLNRYRQEYDKAYLEYPFAEITNMFIKEYYRYLKIYQDSGEETDLDDLSQNLLKRFIEECIEISKRIGFDNFGIEEIVTQISSIRKKIWSLKNDCIYFAQNNEERYLALYAPESVNLIRLKELKEFISSKIEFIENQKR